ncbi:hypothetical protein NDU88_002456 [Pleurodeles waltl]|uniref:Uncharacterized protein n=1 Tax=Pleurodeles waltl TaxID=8319 RepID=A0AAV7VEL6_PLEWA|nr:hypothetical protein NDU88_002456 [Pleurodeles waltl]
MRKENRPRRRTGSRPEDIEEPTWRQPLDPGPAELGPQSGRTKNPTEVRRDRPHPWSNLVATPLPQNGALGEHAIAGEQYSSGPSEHRPEVNHLGP